MDEDTLQSNLGTLKEMILDEEKLVTYVSLSRDLCIHVNDSKSLLTKIIEDIRKKQQDIQLNVSYIISGLCEDNKARTNVWSEKEIKSLRKTFKIVFFEHIYSVSKGLPSVDNVAFLAINKFEDLPLCTGLIKGSSCIKRTTDEIVTLKSNSQACVSVEQKQSNPPSKKVKEEIRNGLGGSKPVTKIHESKSEPTTALTKHEIPSPKKDLPSNSKQKTDNKKQGKTQRDIAGFFSKSNSDSSKIDKKKTVNKKEDIVIKAENERNDVVKVVDKKENIVLKAEKERNDGGVKVEKMDVDEEPINKKEIKDLVSDVPTKKEVAMTEKEIKKENTKEKSKSKSINSIKKNAKVDKKRKRVLQVSDSESDDEKDPFKDEPEPAVNHESEDEIPPTPSVNTVMITSGLVNPKKKRKLVDKTYTDEEGYILTKKEVVYESCSDHEEEVHAKENVEVKQKSLVKLELSPKGKKNGTKISKKKVSPPQKGKQATLMNFFKKA